MDLSFTPEERAFRAEMRDVFRSAIPAEIRERNLASPHVPKQDVVTAQRILNAHGLAVPHWPVAWGGRDWTPVQRYLWLDEMQQAGVPPPLSFNANMVGPVIAQFGDEAQKHRFLPPTANLDLWWCQGFSEPEAGSDLASLRMAARREGADYVVDGQKTWTTHAQHADWIFCLVRTDASVRKQEGISFLLIDMRSPGVTVRPIRTIDGGSEVNEVFFDAVRVPVENRVGAENKGWDIAKFLLGNERTNIARIGISKARLTRIKALAASEGLGEDRRFREKLAAIEVELKALELTQLRVLAEEGKRGDGKPNPASSILKLKGSQLAQATTDLLMDVAGPFVLPAPPADAMRNEASIGPDPEAAATYFNWRKLSIFGGTNEIQRNIVAKAILGL